MGDALAGRVAVVTGASRGIGAAVARALAPGHDLLLRLGQAALRRAGVRAGDLLVALEGGGTTVDVRCTSACSARPVANALTGTHAEGSIAFAP